MVKYQDKDNWKNTTWVMRYIISNMRLLLILGVDDTNMLWCNVDAALGVHHDTKSHAIVMMKYH